MSMPQQAQFIGVIGLAIIIALLAFQRQIGKLRTAALLVTLGTVGGLPEHPVFSILYLLEVLTRHAKIHFFMAAVYSMIALALILFIAWEGLLRGRRTAWYVILGVLIVGGGSELMAGRFIYQHGSPIYAPFGIFSPSGWGWEYLYLYLLAWPSALVVSFRPIFGKSNKEPA